MGISKFQRLKSLHTPDTIVRFQFARERLEMAAFSVEREALWLMVF